MAGGAFDVEYANRKNWKIDSKLLAAMCSVLPDNATVVDIGAGSGHYVKALRSCGYRAHGLDGIDDIETLSEGTVSKCRLHECFRFEIKPMWAICLEVGEHIAAEMADTFLDNLANNARQGLIVSWAVPGQRGRNHVNCRTPEWVASQLGLRRWVLDEPTMLTARKSAGRGWNKKLLVFRPLNFLSATRGTA